MSAKNRRSKRIPSARRLLLTIQNATGAELIKEVVHTVEISAHGAKIRGKRKLKADWRGMLVQLTSGRQIPFRVVWQAKNASTEGHLETGVEFLAEFDFWNQPFLQIEPENADANTAASGTAPIPVSAVSPAALLTQLNQFSVSRGEEVGRFLEAVLSRLVDQLEERKIFTREELIAQLRNVEETIRASH